MTQPSINFADGSFPVPQKSEIQELTEAVRDLAAAVRGDSRQRDVDASLSEWYAGVEDRILRYNELRDREERTLGPGLGDPNIEYATTPEEREEFWGDAGWRPEPESDPVKHPAHYQMGGRECIEFTRDLDFCWGNIVKYLWRAPRKDDPVQDINKALRYLDLAYWSKRPIDEEDHDPFDFFFGLYAEAAGRGSAEEFQLDALAAIFNPFLDEGLVRGRIEDFRNHYLADERA